MRTIELTGLICVMLTLGLPVMASSAPEVAPGACLYLLGAPPGAPVASVEVRDGAAGLLEECANQEAGAEINGGGENWVEAWIPYVDWDSPGSCRAYAWVSHAFRVRGGPEGDLQLHVTMFGEYYGNIDHTHLFNNYNTAMGVRLEAQLLEMEPDTGRWSMVASEAILDRHIITGVRELESQFGRRVEALVRPGTEYSVRLRLEVYDDHANPFIADFPKEIIFGQPGSGFPPSSSSTPHAAYDSIEVCLGEPEDHDEVLDAIAANAAAIAEVDAQAEANAMAIAELRDLIEGQAEERLEWELLNKDCRPGLWLPASQGGRYEEARALVEGRVDAALASGSSGVNGKVAADRLADADGLADAGQYQKACQRLSDALRALTTP